MQVGLVIGELVTLQAPPPAVSFNVTVISVPSGIPVTIIVPVATVDGSSPPETVPAVAVTANVVPTLPPEYSIDAV